MNYINYAEDCANQVMLSLMEANGINFYLINFEDMSLEGMTFILNGSNHQDTQFLPVPLLIW